MVHRDSGTSTGWLHRDAVILVVPQSEPLSDAALLRAKWTIGFVVATLIAIPILYVAYDRANNAHLDGLPAQMMGKTLQQVEEQLGAPTVVNGTHRSYDVGSRGLFQTTSLEIDVDADSKVVKAQIEDEHF